MTAGACLGVTVLLALLGGCAAPVTKPPVPVSDLSQAAPLRPLFQALDALENGTASGPVAILQIGDSHTANDAFSSQMRNLMQSRFGDAGRGMLPPGIPFRLYRPAQVVVTASGWQSIGSLQTSNAGPFGLAGVRQTATGLAAMTLSGEPPNSFDEVLIEALGQPGGGTIDVTAGAGPALTLSTDAPQDTPLWLSVPTGAAKLVLHAGGDGPTTVLSWTAIKHRPGVTWSNLGTIGATIDTLGRFDPNLVKAELDHLQPVLILIAFGTNEGFDDTTDPAAYEARYAVNLRMLHAAAPQASILVVGAPDGSRKGSTTATCLTPGAGSPGWSAPPRLGELREAQRRVARAEGSYFWDWSAAMGGACSMQVWARANPPMAAADHVHLLTPGYRATADKLFEELMRHYDRYREAAHPG